MCRDPVQRRVRRLLKRYFGGTAALVDLVLTLLGKAESWLHGALRYEQIAHHATAQASLHRTALALLNSLETAKGRRAAVLLGDDERCAAKQRLDELRASGLDLYESESLCIEQVYYRTPSEPEWQRYSFRDLSGRIVTSPESWPDERDGAAVYQWTCRPTLTGYSAVIINEPPFDSDSTVDQREGSDGLVVLRTCRSDIALLVPLDSFFSNDDQNSIV